MSDSEEANNSSGRSSALGRSWAVVNATGEVESSIDDGSDSGKEASAELDRPCSEASTSSGQVAAVTSSVDDESALSRTCSSIAALYGTPAAASMSEDCADDTVSTGKVSNLQHKNSKSLRNASSVQCGAPVDGNATSYVQSANSVIIRDMSGHLLEQVCDPINAKAVLDLQSNDQLSSGSDVQSDIEMSAGTASDVQNPDPFSTNASDITCDRMSASLTSLLDLQFYARSSSSDSSVEMMNWVSVSDHENDDLSVFDGQDMVVSTCLSNSALNFADKKTSKEDLVAKDSSNSSGQESNDDDDISILDEDETINEEPNQEVSTPDKACQNISPSQPIEACTLSKLHSTDPSALKDISAEYLDTAAASYSAEGSSLSPSISEPMFSITQLSPDFEKVDIVTDTHQENAKQNKDHKVAERVAKAEIENGNNENMDAPEESVNSALDEGYQEESTVFSSFQRFLSYHLQQVSTKLQNRETRHSRNLAHGCSTHDKDSTAGEGVANANENNAGIGDGNTDVNTDAREESVMRFGGGGSIGSILKFYFNELCRRSDGAIEYPHSSESSTHSEDNAMTDSEANANENNAAIEDGSADAIEESEISELERFEGPINDFASFKRFLSFQVQRMRAGHRARARTGRNRRRNNPEDVIKMLAFVIFITLFAPLLCFITFSPTDPVVIDEQMLQQHRDNMKGLGGAISATAIENDIKELIQERSGHNQVRAGRLLPTVSNIWRTHYEDLVTEKNLLMDRLAAMQDHGFPLNGDIECTKILDQERIAFDELSERLFQLNAELSKVAANLSQSRYNLNDTQTKINNFIIQISLLKVEKSALIATKEKLHEDLMQCLFEKNKLAAEKQQDWMRLESVRERVLKNEINELKLENTELQELLANQRYGKHPGNSMDQDDLQKKADKQNDDLFHWRNRFINPNPEDSGRNKNNLINDDVQNDDGYQSDGDSEVSDDEIYDVKDRRILLIEEIDAEGTESVWVNEIFPERSSSVGVTGDHIGFISRALTDAAAVDLSVALLPRLDLNLTQWCGVLKERLNDKSAIDESTEDDDEDYTSRQLVAELKDLCSNLASAGSFRSKLHSVVDGTLTKLSEVVTKVENLAEQGQKKGEKFTKKMKTKVLDTLAKLHSNLKSKFSGVQETFASWKTRWFKTDDNKNYESDEEAQKIFKTQKNMIQPEKLLHDKYFKRADKDKKIAQIRDALQVYIDQLQNSDSFVTFADSVAHVVSAGKNTGIQSVHANLHMLAKSLQKSTPMKVRKWILWQEQWWKKTVLGKKFEVKEIVKGGKFWSTWQLEEACEQVLIRPKTSRNMKQSLEKICQVRFNEEFKNAESFSPMSASTHDEVKSDDVHGQHDQVLDDSKRDTDAGASQQDDDATIKDEDSLNDNSLNNDGTLNTDGSLNDEEKDDATWYFERMEDREDGRHDPSWYLRALNKEELGQPSQWYINSIKEAVHKQDITDDEVYKNQKKLHDRYCSRKHGCRIRRRSGCTGEKRSWYSSLFGRWLKKRCD